MIFKILLLASKPRLDPNDQMNANTLDSGAEHWLKWINRDVRSANRFAEMSY